MESGLINFNKDNILSWQNCLLDYSTKYGELYFISDTETTGVEIRNDEDGYNRVLEWSGCFCYKNEDGFLEICKDEKGNEIAVDEVVNPFFHRTGKSPKENLSIKYVPKESTKTHGLTLDYLFAEKGTGDKKKSTNAGGEGESETIKETIHRESLPHMPGSFKDVFSTVLALLSEVVSKTDNITHAVFHNAPFDFKFLDMECEMAGFSSFESYFCVTDTMDMAKKILKIHKMSLDRVYDWGKENCPHLINDVDRPIHTAMIDSLILVQVYNVLVYAHKNNLTAK